MTYRAHIKNGVAVLDEPVSLPEGTPVVVQALDAIGFSENLSIPELAKRQQVPSRQGLDALAGDWPSEDRLGDFLEAVREARR